MYERRPCKFGFLAVLALALALTTAGKEAEANSLSWSLSNSLNSGSGGSVIVEPDSENSAQALLSISDFAGGKSILSGLSSYFGTPTATSTQSAFVLPERRRGSVDNVLSTTLGGEGSPMAVTTMSAMVVKAMMDGSLPDVDNDCLADDGCSNLAQPIPGAVWLLASALLALVGIGYRRRQAGASA